jgi:hypothetical protein
MVRVGQRQFITLLKKNSIILFVQSDYQQVKRVAD